MPVRIRLQRFGRRNLPFYRIVVADSRAPRDGRFLENVGTYNPIAFEDKVKEITANGERVKYWLSCGAQPSERVSWLFGKVGLLPPAVPRMSVKTAIPKEFREKEEKKATPKKAEPPKKAPEKKK
jgi:small subunit ribosomal protein S16